MADKVWWKRPVSDWRGERWVVCSKDDPDAVEFSSPLPVDETVQVWLRLVDGGTDNECWVVCSKGDPGAVEFQPVGFESVWLGEADGFKSFTRKKSVADMWRKSQIKVTECLESN